MLSRLHPNSALKGFKNTPNVNTSIEPKLTITPKNAASTTSHPERVWSREAAEDSAAVLFADIAVRGSSPTAFLVALIRQCMNARGVDPTVIEVKQSAYRDGIVDRFVIPTDCVQRLHIGGADIWRILVHLNHKPEQGLVLL
jgi:zona occludens toxin (predicted ATPase)